MVKRIHVVGLGAALLVGSSVAAQAQQSGPGTTRSTAPDAAASSVTPEYSRSMESLLHAAQRLRESIQALAQQPPGARRDAAIKDARRALHDTQQAMLAMPPEWRQGPGAAAGDATASAPPGQSVDFATSMTHLERAAGRLRDAIEAMAKQSTGPGRNEAVREAYEALFETRRAMAVVPGSGPRDASVASQSGAAGGEEAKGLGTGSRSPGGGSISGPKNRGDAPR